MSVAMKNETYSILHTQNVVLGSIAENAESLANKMESSEDEIIAGSNPTPRVGLWKDIELELPLANVSNHIMFQYGVHSIC